MKGRRRGRAFTASAALKRWWASPRHSEVARAGLEIARSRPRCNATAKATGLRCRSPAMPNGKCRTHGGKTPRGAGWHKTTLPAKGEQRGLEKFEKKLAAKEKREAQRRRALAAMTPEQRERHEKWQASHRPGPPGERAQRRATKQLIDELLAASDARRAAEEQRELALRAEALRDRARQAQATCKDPPEPEVDVFA